MRARHLFSWLLVVVLVTACSSIGGPQKDRLDGLASWYGNEYAGRRTANGEIFDPMAYTAAHRTLPFGTIVRVTNQRNGRTVDVRINDRGPFIESRIIDVSYAAAIELDMVKVGVAPVTLSILKTGAGEREAPKPYVVTIPSPKGAAVADSPPPPVAFPLPKQTTEDEIVIDGSDITVEVIEGSAEPSRKTTSPDGRSIVPAPAPRQPPEASPAPRAGQFVIQLGAFAVEENARRLKLQADSLAGPVYIERDGALYRVRVGPFSTRIGAIEAREKLDEAGFQTLLVTLD